QLVKADGCGNIGEVVLVAGRQDPIIPASGTRISVPGVVRQPVQGHRPHTGSKVSVCRDRHAPLAGGDRLVGVEGETSDSRGGLPAAMARTTRSVAPPRSAGFCRTLD